MRETKRAKKLLEDWANLATEYPAAVLRKSDEAAVQNLVPQFTEEEKAKLAEIDNRIAAFMRRFPEVFDLLPDAPPRPANAQSLITSNQWDTVASIQVLIRRAWNAPTPRERHWHIFKARDKYRFTTVEWPLFQDRICAANQAGMIEAELAKPRPDQEYQASISPPPLTAFEQYMEDFRKTVHTARRCSNPECKNPYFFAQRNQRYCSGKCALPALREQKREYWRRKHELKGSHQ